MLSTKSYGRALNLLRKLSSMSRTSKIGMFKTFLRSKENHLITLIEITGNTLTPWKEVRNIIISKVMPKVTIHREIAFWTKIFLVNFEIAADLVREETKKNWK